MADETRRVREKMLERAERFVHVAGNDLLGAAQRDAPVDEATLRASGELEVERTGNAVTGTVSFNTVYAAEQHEREDFEHPRGGSAKYLERNLKERQARYERGLAAAMSGAL